jgi:hypothetical protein
VPRREQEGCGENRLPPIFLEYVVQVPPEEDLLRESDKNGLADDEWAE